MLNPRYLTQSEAAAIARVNRSAINQLIFKDKYQFFLKIGGAWKVDTSHPDWKVYLQDKDKKSNQTQDDPLAQDSHQRISKTKADLIEIQLAKEIDLLIIKDEATALTFDFINKFSRQVSLIFQKILPQVKIYIEQRQDIKANELFLGELEQVARQVKKEVSKNA